MIQYSLKKIEHFTIVYSLPAAFQSASALAVDDHLIIILPLTEDSCDRIFVSRRHFLSGSMAHLTLTVFFAVRTAKEQHIYCFWTSPKYHTSTISTTDRRMEILVVFYYASCDKFRRSLTSN